MYLIRIGWMIACRYVPAAALTRSPDAVNSAIITSPAIPIELRDERWKTSSASSRMSLVRWKPIS
jgi:hypothetical protein